MEVKCKQSNWISILQRSNWNHFFILLHFLHWKISSFFHLRLYLTHLTRNFPLNYRFFSFHLPQLPFNLKCQMWMIIWNILWFFFFDVWLNYSNSIIIELDFFSLYGFTNPHHHHSLLFSCTMVLCVIVHYE